MNRSDAISSADLDGGEFVPERPACSNCGEEMDAADAPVGLCENCRREQREYDGPSDGEAWSGGFATNH